LQGAIICFRKLVLVPMSAFSWIAPLSLQCFK
jgi:hypothetical protein